MKNKPTVGQTLYSLNVGNAARHAPQVLTPVKVVKVGTKYFECVHPGYGRGTVYHLDTWCEKTEYSSDSVLYESPKEYKDSIRMKQLCNDIFDAFHYGGNKLNVSLQNLERINQILLGIDK